MKILIISPKNKTVFNFRGDLIKDMVKNGHDLYVTGPNQDYIDEINNLGVKKFYEVKLKKDSISIISDFLYFMRLMSVIRKTRPDIVFGYTYKPIIYGSIAAGLARVPHVFAMVTGLGRAYSSKSLKARMIQWITKWLFTISFGICEKVIFQNRDDMNELTRGKCLNEDKAFIINGSGVNLERFAPSPLPEKMTFLMVGRIIKEKGVMEYCEAARFIKQQYPDVRFILLGGYDSSIGAISENDMRRYTETGIVEMPGEVSDPVEYYRQSSVFVLPSYYREGLPRVLLEAMACSRPVITTDWVGCREPVIDGKNGFLVPIRNIDKLVEKMLFFIHHPDNAKSMGEKAHEICQKRYAVSIVNSQMKAILNY